MQFRITPEHRAPIEQPIEHAEAILEVLSSAARGVREQKLFGKKKPKPASPEEGANAYVSYTFVPVFERSPGADGKLAWHLQLRKNVHPPGKPLLRVTAELPVLPGVEDLRTSSFVLVEALDGGRVTASRKFFR